MLLIPHQTRCPACERFVFVTDTLFVAENWKGVEKIRGFVPGIYHDACFRKSPHREAYLAIDREIINAQLDNPNEYLVVIGRTPQLAVTFRDIATVYQLYFLSKGTTLRFRGLENWQRFLALITGPDTLQPTAPEERGDIRIRRSHDAWELATRGSTSITIELATADYNRLQQYCMKRRVDPERTPIDIGSLCLELDIKPIVVGCPLERLKGTFSWPETMDETVTITVQIETWNIIPLTQEELEELRRFLRELGRK
jgi:hypothetical protein